MWGFEFGDGSKSTEKPFAATGRDPMADQKIALATVVPEDRQTESCPRE
jgi:hypothetical protein